MLCRYYVHRSVLGKGLAFATFAPPRVQIGKSFVVYVVSFRSQTTESERRGVGARGVGVTRSRAKLAARVGSRGAHPRAWLVGAMAGDDASRAAAAREAARGAHRSMREPGLAPPDAATRVAEAARAAEPLLDMKQRTTRDDPDGFMDTFFRASRLHYIGTWKHRYEAFLEDLPAPPPLPPTKRGDARVTSAYLARDVLVPRVRHGASRDACFGRKKRGVVARAIGRGARPRSGRDARDRGSSARADACRSARARTPVDAADTRAARLVAPASAHQFRHRTPIAPRAQRFFVVKKNDPRVRFRECRRRGKLTIVFG